MATRRSKNAENERLDQVHIERVIEHLANKGTKKDACSILNIAYNTSRLDKIIDKYNADKEYRAAKRAEKRGTPATEAEVSYSVKSYLEGETVDSISKSLFRGPTFVTSILEKYGVPRRQTGHSYFRPGLVPEEAMRDNFRVGEKVYSMRYDSLATIESEFKKGVYSIYLLSDRQKQFAYQPAEELASLEHLREAGINV
jgi:hypothetical protein